MTPRRSPRAAAARIEATAPDHRPPLAVFATVFALLVAAEDAYLAWLLWTPAVGWDPLLLVPSAMAVLALVAAAAVFLGRARGWLLLTVAAALPLIVVLGLIGLFAMLGGGTAMWGAVLLLVGPVGALVLALRPPVRAWTRPGRTTPSPGGRHSRADGR